VALVRKMGEITQARLPMMKWNKIFANQTWTDISLIAPWCDWIQVQHSTYHKISSHIQQLYRQALLEF